MSQNVDIPRPKGRAAAVKQKSGLVWISPDQLRPSPENARLYKDDETSLRTFSDRIRRDGILEPLVITRDLLIVSGHRRRAAALLAGLTVVPCRKLSQNRTDFTPDEYVKLLREFNRQRSKSIDEILREAAIDANPEVAYYSLVESRVKRARDGAGSFGIEGFKLRAEISANKRPMLDSALHVIKQMRNFWPLSVRQIHYCLLSDPPLRHAKKPESRYQNNRACYNDLCDLLARARISGRLSWGSISDETRPVRLWPTFRSIHKYVENELSNLFGNYWRDLLQSQANHYEILIEKNASLSVIEQVAMKYTVPITSGRGQCSKQKLWQIAERFRVSGKNKLILFILSDFDPDGDAIANANALSLRDDLLVEEIEPVRVALRLDQVTKFKLPQSLEAKESSRNYEKFVRKHGVRYAVELEALPPQKLQDELDRAIRSHIDVQGFNREVEQEKLEASKLQGLKRDILTFVRDRNCGKEDGEVIENEDLEDIF